jgi:acyl-CoA thioesterase
MDHHPYADLIDLVVDERRAGHSRCSIRLAAKHMNPHGVAHGAVLYALADTGMGAALYPTLEPGELCATIEIKITYFKPVAGGTVVCTTEMPNRGRSVAHLESSLHVDGRLVARAAGSFAIFRPTPRASGSAPPSPQETP